MSQPIPIIYASTSGHVEAVCERVAQIWNQAGQSTELLRAEQTSIEVIAQSSLLVLASSTWEHGELNPFFFRLYKEMNTIDCSGKFATFIGCGDPRYEPVLINNAAKLLRARWLERGGSELASTLFIQGEPYPFLDTTVTDWANKVLLELPDHAA